MGNICNATDPKKCRADGYNYDAIHATMRARTQNGDSMLKFICKKIKEQESGISQLKASFKECEQAKKNTIQMIQSQMDLLKGSLAANINLFDKVKSDDPELCETIFGKNIQEFLEEIEPQVNEANTIMNEVHTKFE